MEHIVTFCIVSILALVIEMSYKVKIINRQGDVNDYSIEVFQLRDIFVFFILLFIIYLLLQVIKSYKYSFKNKIPIDKGLFYGLPLFFLLSWAPYYFTFFPGTGMQDEVFSMRWPILTLNQPFFYNILLAFFYRIGKFIGNTDITIGILTFLEETFMAVALSYLIYWLNKKRCSRLFLSVIILSFAILPIFPNYAISLVKDKLFAVILLLLSLNLYDFINDPKNKIKDRIWVIKFVILNCLMIIIRSNGIFIFIPLIVILLKTYGNQSYRKKIISMSVITILLGSTQFFAVRYFAHGHVPFKESVGIPIQQLGYVIAKNRSLPNESEKIVQQIMPIEKWKVLYRPWSSDPIKWNKEFNETYLDSHKKAFLKAYFLTMPYNYKNYVQAYLFGTFGFWSVMTWDSSQTIFSCAFTPDIIEQANPNGKVNEVYHLGNCQVLSENVKSFWGNILRNYSVYLGAGTCAWILLFIVAVCLYNGENIKIIPLLPALLCWMTLMISVPVNFAFRYAFMFAVCMPFILAVPFIKMNEEDIDEHEQ